MIHMEMTYSLRLLWSGLLCPRLFALPHSFSFCRYRACVLSTYLPIHPSLGPSAHTFPTSPTQPSCFTRYGPPQSSTLPPTDRPATPSRPTLEGPEVQRILVQASRKGATEREQQQGRLNYRHEAHPEVKHSVHLPHLRSLPTYLPPRLLSSWYITKEDDLANRRTGSFSLFLTTSHIEGLIVRV